MSVELFESEPCYTLGDVVDALRSRSWPAWHPEYVTAVLLTGRRELPGRFVQTRTGHSIESVFTVPRLRFAVFGHSHAGRPLVRAHAHPDKTADEIARLGITRAFLLEPVVFREFASGYHVSERCHVERDQAEGYPGGDLVVADVLTRTLTTQLFTLIEPRQTLTGDRDRRIWEARACGVDVEITPDELARIAGAEAAA